MDSFSWTDILRASLSSCFPSFAAQRPSTFPEHERRRPISARYDELEGLLADEDDRGEADTLSLHSNVGSGEGIRTVKRAGRKGFSLLGWNFFGRPPIQLDDESDSEVLSRRRRSRAHPFWSSSSTLDSDAAPLDSAAIEQLSSPRIPAPQPTLEERAALAAVREEEERRLKDERKQRRRERRELKRAAQAQVPALGIDDTEFEGYQGSGQFSAHLHALDSPLTSSPNTAEEFGPYVQNILASHKDDQDVDTADLGGEFYAKRSNKSGASSGSGSRSHTSASRSNTGRFQAIQTQHYTSQQPAHVPKTHQKRKKDHLYISKPSSRNSESSTSQSTSLHSPKSVPLSVDAQIVDPEAIYSPRELLKSTEALPSATNTGFPSVGFGGMRRKNSDMGAFLARRGDQD